MSTIKEVNKIFYANYSGVGKGTEPHTELLLKLVWAPIVVFACLGVTMPFVSFIYEEIILMAILGLILAVLFYISLKTFYDKPNQNNQIEQSICDVNTYFQTLNETFYKRGIAVEWNCSKDFMYLEVIFHNGFPG